MVFEHSNVFQFKLRWLFVCCHLKWKFFPCRESIVEKIETLKVAEGRASSRRRQFFYCFCSLSENFPLRDWNVDAYQKSAN